MIRRAEPGDIDDILPRIKPCEREAVVKLGLDPAELLRAALPGYTYTGLVGSRVACMWGIVFGSLGQFPSMWVLTTELVDEHRVEFLRESRKFVRWATAEFGPLEGFCDCANPSAARWLSWLGFRPVETFQGYTRMRT